MPILTSKADQSAIRRIVLSGGLGAIFGLQCWRLAEDGFGVSVSWFGVAWILVSHVCLGFSISATAGLSSWWKRGPVQGLLISIPSGVGAAWLGLRWIPHGAIVLTAGTAAGILIAAIADALFPVRPRSKNEGPTASRPVPEAGHVQSEKCQESPIWQRLAEEKGYLEHVDAEREYQGDPGFEKATEDRIVWGELLDLELQDIDEQVRRISQIAGDAFDRRSLQRQSEILF